MQVFANLIDNAADAVAGEPDAWIRLAATTNDGIVAIEVTDSGEPPPPSIQQRMFDKSLHHQACARWTGCWSWRRATHRERERRRREVRSSGTTHHVSCAATHAAYRPAPRCSRRVASQPLPNHRLQGAGLKAGGQLIEGRGRVGAGTVAGSAGQGPAAGPGSGVKLGNCQGSLVMTGGRGAGVVP